MNIVTKNPEKFMSSEIYKDYLLDERLKEN